MSIQVCDINPSLFPASLKGLSIKDQFLMCEAYRRACIRRDTTSPRMLGLGMKTEYGKSTLFRATHSRNPPRCLCWWDLKGEGVLILKAMAAELPIDKVI